MRPTRETVVTVLLTAPSVAAAARRLGVTARTVRRWRTRPEVQAALGEARRALVTRGVTRLCRATDAAARRLRRNLRCGQPAVEVAAAKAILDAATKAVEVLDLAERVERLEAALTDAGDDEEDPPAWPH